LIGGLSDTGEHQLNYDELRAFDDQIFFKTKENVRREMLGKDLAEILDSSTDALRELLAKDPNLGEVIASGTGVRILEALQKYVRGGDDLNPKSAAQLEALTAALRSGEWSQDHRIQLSKILADERIYRHERTIFPGLDQVLQSRIEQLL